MIIEDNETTTAPGNYNIYWVMRIKTCMDINGMPYCP